MSEERKCQSCGRNSGNSNTCMNCLEEALADLDDTEAFDS